MKIAKRVKIEFGLLLGIIALLLVYIFLFSEKSAVNYKLPSLPGLESDQIERISVLSEGEKNLDVEMVRIKQPEGQDTWQLTHIGKSADGERVEKIVEALSEMTLVDMVSERGNYAAYGLDEKSKKTVAVNYREKMEGENSDKNGEEKSLVLEVGNISRTQSYSYAKFPDKKEVYSLRGSLASLINSDEEELRDKKIFRFNSAELKTLIISEGSNIKNNENRAGLENSKQLILSKKEGSNDWVDQTGKVFLADDLDKLLYFGSNLNCDGFSEEIPEPDSALLNVEFGFDKEKLELTVIKEADRRYLCTSSTSDEPFFVSYYIINLYSKLLNGK